MSEVHGWPTRRKCITYVKLGDKVDSPVIEKGEADILLCFEKLEALRYIDYARKDGIIIVNDQRIDPMPVIIGKQNYPDDITSKISSNNSNVYIIDALEVAANLGNIRVLNIVMVGF